MSKIVFIGQTGDSYENVSLWVAESGGISKLVDQTVDDYSTDQDAVVLSDNFSWSFDSTKIAMTDPRDANPVWLFELDTDIHSKMWGGSGWDNPDEQKWIYDIQNFDGG